MYELMVITTDDSGRASGIRKELVTVGICPRHGLPYIYDGKNGMKCAGCLNDDAESYEGMKRIIYGW